jgi:hypothetical protein
MAADAGERNARPLHQRYAGFHLMGGFLQQAADLLGGTRRTLGKLAHLHGDDGKALARLARTRRLDTGIERQQVGLEGDGIDHRNDRVDLPRRGLDRLHRRDRIAHDLAGAGRLALGVAGNRSACSARSICERTDWVIASMALAVSVIEAACRSVRPASSSAPVRISSEPARTAIELPPIAVIVSLSAASAWLKLTRRPSSSFGKRRSIWIGEIAVGQMQQSLVDRLDHLLQRLRLRLALGHVLLAVAIGPRPRLALAASSSRLSISDCLEARQRLGHRTDLVAAVLAADLA